MTVDLETAPARAHLDETVRIWLGLPIGAPVQAPTLPTELARVLLRAEEYEQSHRDRWDCWEYSFSENFRRGRLWVPEIDRWLSERRSELSGTTALEPLWPQGHRFAVCMTHDVDLVSRASTPRQALRSMRTSLTDRPDSLSGHAVRLARPAIRAARSLANGISTAPLADTLERSLQVELERDIRASYFFTVWPGGASSRYDCTYDFDDVCRFRGERMRIRDVIRAIHEDGFDVGLHGSYNSAVSPGMLARERSSLEAATGLPISTTRQHFLHWHVRTTPRLQLEAGLSADSSLGFNRNLGFRAGTSLPFRWFDLERDQALDLLELPVIVQDGTLRRADALELDLELAWEVVRQLVDAVSETGGVATFVVHPNNLEHDEDLELLVRSLDYCLERGAWFASLRQLAEWWREREQRLRS